MLNVKNIKLVDSREVFDAIQNKFNKDVEGTFNEIYYPPSDGAILFNLPANKEGLEWLEECEQYVVDILMNEGGFNWGESCYLDFDY
jgi:hypothetical protein